MATLYLDRKDSELNLEGGALVIRNPEGRKTVPLALVQRVVIAAKTYLDTNLLGRLAEAGVAVMLLDPRHGTRRAQLLGNGHNDASVRLAQYRACADAAYCLDFAKSLVAAKLRRQCRWLTETTGRRRDIRSVLEDAADKLQALAGNIRQAQSLDQLLGMEGSGGRIYFQAYARLFPASLSFQGRRRRPPPDPVNAVLSLSYALLHTRAVQMAWAAGLDPLLGFYHQPYWGRESLACDLVEPWRPCLDEWAYQWFRQRWLQAGHFSRAGSGCRLGKSGRQRFFSAFEQQVKPLQRALRRQATTLVKELKTCKPSI
ncbi:MAG: hypothetical protein AXA67_03755 [Methylothermaceae bacteria B42]|nr:MAG: hypothetical protein AXA67_03755 [Methylothermaceae bacteria B42]HHJ38558.1 CRISPR-associated endonuclease Cas1 [Methylothermaceae bacterium]